MLNGDTMKKIEDRDTRYFIDLDLQALKIIKWDYGQRDTLSQELSGSHQQRVFITRGQYYKLLKRMAK